MLSWLKQMRLEAPAAIFAETYEPLGYFLAQGLLAVAPLWPGDHLTRLAAALQPDRQSPPPAHTGQDER